MCCIALLITLPAHTATFTKMSYENEFTHFKSILCYKVNSIGDVARIELSNQMGRAQVQISACEIFLQIYYQLILDVNN